MNAEKEILEEVVRYLRLSSRPHLADSIEEVPEANREALYNMISDMEYHKVQATIISFHVSEDVTAVLAGKAVVFSAEYLEGQNEQ